MSGPNMIQVLLFLGLLLGLVPLLGHYMARVYEGKPCGLDRLLGPIERMTYRVSGVDHGKEMTWKRYAATMLGFNALGLLAVYILQRVQGFLPLNPDGLGAVEAGSAFNTAVSFATNTNWQGYGGERTMSHLTQMLGLSVQNFLSAATGMAVLVALIRGFTRKNTLQIGNFWVDLVRSTLYILLPLSIIWALVLVSQGVVQNFSPSVMATLAESQLGADGKAITEQSLA
jgi:K+-transporting ATPase ATPase A chain